MIGYYENNNEIRAFGLDRINNLKVLEQGFKTKLKIETINNYYKDSFAMFTDGEVENVTLSFDLRDGNYINSHPIHFSQKCEINQEKTRYFIYLKIKITLDFMMELMSRAWSLKVIEPLHLRDKMVTFFEEALDRNKN